MQEVLPLHEHVCGAHESPRRFRHGSVIARSDQDVFRGRDACEDPGDDAILAEIRESGLCAPPFPSMTAGTDSGAPASARAPEQRVHGIVRPAPRHDRRALRRDQYPEHHALLRPPLQAPPSRRTLVRAVAGIAATTALVSLSGCTGMLVLDAAEEAADPDCALPILLMPDELSDLPAADHVCPGHDRMGRARQCDRALRGEVAPPAPTTDPCVSVDGVDWVQVRAEEDTWQFVTYRPAPPQSRSSSPPRRSTAPQHSRIGVIRRE